MRTLNDYLKLPYKLELVEDPDEGGYVVPIPICPAAFPAARRLKAQWPMRRTPKKCGWRRRWKTA